MNMNYWDGCTWSSGSLWSPGTDAWSPSHSRGAAQGQGCPRHPPWVSSGPHFSTNADWFTSSFSGTPHFPSSVNGCAQSSSWNTTFVSHSLHQPTPWWSSDWFTRPCEQSKHRRWVESSLVSLELGDSLQEFEGHRLRVPSAWPELQRFWVKPARAFLW